MLNRFRSIPILTLVLFAMVLCLEFNPFIPDNASGPLPRLAIVSLLMFFTMRGIKVARYVLAFLLAGASLFLVAVTIIAGLPGLGLLIPLYFLIPAFILISTAANLIFSRKLKRFLTPQITVSQVTTAKVTAPQTLDSKLSGEANSSWPKIKTLIQEYKNKLSRNMKVIIAILICGIAVTIFAISQDEKFNVSFGVIEEINGYSSIEHEANIIEYIPKSEGHRFGFIITAKDKHPFKYHTLSYLPATPNRFSGTLSETSADHFLSGAKSIEETATNSVVLPFWFDEGDPLGVYKIDLYINDVKFKSVEFTVVPKK
jgi:hypothetical protein